MESKSKGRVSNPDLKKGPVVKPVMDQLAAMLFYEKLFSGIRDLGPGVTDFEFLTKEDQDQYVKAAQKVVLALSKINKMIVDYADPEKVMTDRAQKIDAIEKVIAGFVRILKHPRGVADFFPAKEMATLIVDRCGR
jgi:hypothetical protein